MGPSTQEASLPAIPEAGDLMRLPHAGGFLRDILVLKACCSIPCLRASELHHDCLPAALPVPVLF